MQRVSRRYRALARYCGIHQICRVAATLPVAGAVSIIGAPSADGAATTSAVAPPRSPAFAAPEARTAAAIGGVFVAGARLTAHSGLWSGGRPLSFTYSWQRCDDAALTSCAAVAVGRTYVAGAPGAGSWLRVRVTARNAFGSATSVSPAAGPVETAGVHGLKNVAAPGIGGLPQEGEPLEAWPGVWQGDARTSFRYQWRRCLTAICEDIDKATASTYTPTTEDVGGQLYVVTTATEPSGETVSAISPAMLTVASVTPPIILDVPATVTARGADLRWSMYGGAGFIRYEVHRSQSANFTPDASTLLTTVVVPTVTSYSDRSGYAEELYFYKIVARASSGSYFSNEQEVALPPPGSTTLNVQLGPTNGRSGWIYKNSADPSTTCRNNGSDPLLGLGVSGTQTARALLRFDLPAVPAGAEVSSAELAVTLTTLPTAQLTVQVYEATTDWTEGSGINQCTLDGASWDEARGGVSWTTPGGDLTPDATSRQGQDPGDGAARWDRTDVTGLARNWYGGFSPNQGIILLVNDESDTSNRYLRMSSDDASDPTQRPVFSVTYSTETENNEDTVIDAPAPAAKPANEPSLDPWTDPTATDQCTGTSQPACPNNRCPDTMAAGIWADSLPGYGGPGPTGPVCVRRGKYGVTVRNDDGRWTIYYSCHGPGEMIGGMTRTVTAGPGYIVTFRDEHFLTPSQRIAPVTLVDGEQVPTVETTQGTKRRHIFEAGGLGLFGLHALRSTQAPGSVTIGSTATETDVVEQQLCAKPGVTAQSYGVYASTVLNCAGNPQACNYISTGAAVIEMDVWLRDRWGQTGEGADDPSTPVVGDALVKVHNIWVFYPETVKLFSSVTTYAKPNSAGMPYVKEPKYVASLIGDVRYPRIAVFSGYGASFVPPGHVKAGAEFADIVSTEHEGVGPKGLNGGRTRVRWDLNTVVRGPRVSASGNCLASNPDDPCQRAESISGCSAQRSCFSVAMRAYDPARVDNRDVYQVSTTWESGLVGGKGLDLWAVRSSPPGPDDSGAVCRPSVCLNRARANLTDSPNPTGTPCNTQRVRQQGTRAQVVRRWEFQGRKASATAQNRYPFIRSGTSFHGWEGGRGYNDCEPL